MKNNIILLKIKEYCIQIIEFTNAIELDVFNNDKKTIAACVFNLSQIGELVNKLEVNFTTKYINIPWQSIKGMRNKIVHDYDGVQLTIIWDVIANYIPDLIRKIDIILENESK